MQARLHADVEKVGQSRQASSVMLSKTTTEQETEVYLLPLTDDGAPDVLGGYISLPPPTTPPYCVRFSIEGTSSICRDGSLWVNFASAGEQFGRENFKGFILHSDFSRNIEISIPVTAAGVFAFYATHSTLPKFSQASSTQPKQTRTPTYYINVAPRLTINNETIPLDALCVFSVISKFMGQYPRDWKAHLESIQRRNYNVIHFSPLMTRGESDSPYSIYDQLAFDPKCFPRGERDISELLQHMETKQGLFGLTDVVWNHTANNSKWLEDHPEAGYSLETAPWLEAALELDTALLKFGKELANHGLPTDLKSDEDLSKLIGGIREVVCQNLRLWEYYIIDVPINTQNIIRAWTEGKPLPDLGLEIEAKTAADWSLREKAILLHRGLDEDLFGARYQRRIDPAVGAQLLTAMYGQYDLSDPLRLDEKILRRALTEVLNEVNDVWLYNEYESDYEAILSQLRGRIGYLRLDSHGPKLGPFTDQHPLIETYFTRLPSNSVTRKHNPKSLALVNNGWIWNGNALVDNAGPTLRPYLRREVIVWSDCVKLRYGARPTDSPFLWEHMTTYTRLMAKYFRGFRIDNCHSTPIHVAEYLLDEARKVRPDLLVCAELFTGNEEMDFLFVKRLGINCLIREAMQAWSTEELSRLVHRHGGTPIGSFEIDEVASTDQAPSISNDPLQPHMQLCRKERVHRIKQTPVHALFMDCTHDNEVPAQKREARDTLPNAALVNMCASATGSVMGYDEIYPKLLDLVHETRLYHPTAPGQAGEGIGEVKSIMNKIHTLMGKDGYEETFIHHENEFITIHRVHPVTRKGYFCIARTAFPAHGGGSGSLNPVHLGGTKARQMRAYNLTVDASEEEKERIASNKTTLNGLSCSIKRVDQELTVEDRGSDSIISITGDFPPGSAALFETWIPCVDGFLGGLDNFITSGVRMALAQTDLIDLNFVLYRCEPEERDGSDGQDGVYVIPNHGPLVYAGLQGWWSILKHIIRSNDLGHALCQHLREGQWALDYTLGRLQRISEKEGFGRLKPLVLWLNERFDAIRTLPSSLLPRYFALVMQTAYAACWDRAVELMGEHIRKGQWFLQSLAMVSVQQVGLVKSASLYPERLVPSLAAGLPHFASSWARCWGRDVFISMRGLLLATGRYVEAKQHIKAFASVLKHGMIPNLLGSGKTPRYNSRDSVWFFLQAIQDYVKIVPNGIDILKETVSRRFLPFDDTHFEFDDPRAYSETSTITEIIQEVLQRHAQGLNFREANAGIDLDMQMKPSGFDIQIKVDWKTGLIFGGSQDNCGTWMDKMGESEKAGNKGVPGTPRDGAAVEITGLLYSALVWINRLHQEKQYPVSGVDIPASNGERARFTFQQWADLIKENFERCYYIPTEPQEDASYDVDPNVVNRRGIYKDLYKSGEEYEDYQLRPNFSIAMCVAPQLFDPEKARGALFIADRILRGPTGMATLDPNDLKYRPNYNNSEDSTDFETSKGRNYHQGPEWLWPTGYFLRAMLKFDLMRRTSKAERTESFQQITQRLKGCKQAIQDSPWAGLAELTNQGGAFCHDSSPTQAWSASCLIDLFLDAAELAQTEVESGSPDEVRSVDIR